MSMTIQSNVKDKILATSSETSKVENAPAQMLCDLDQQMEKRADDGCTLWIKLYSKYEYEICYHPGKANVVIEALSKKERVKPRRIRAMAMTIQYGVRGMILTTQSEAFNKEWNSGDDQLRFRWMIYFVVLADAAESVSDAIRFEYCLASSSGWTKSPVLWAEIGESSLIGPELVQETTDKVVLIKEKLKAARDRQKSYVDFRRKQLEFEVRDRVLLKVTPWKGVVRFGKKGKLAPRYVGPFKILKRIGPVAYSLRLLELNTAYPLPSDTAYPVLCPIQQQILLIVYPLRHFKTPSLDKLRSPGFNLLSDQEYSEEEEAEAMAETMKQYMSKTRMNYGSGVARPKIDNKDQFELKGQFLKELQENMFSDSDNKDTNEHIEKVLEIVDLFHVPNIIVDQLMLRVFPISLTGAASHWLRNEPSGSIKTWEDLKTKFLNNNCPPG
ncbi:putative reverse transcriptase domain-containing protein [Tanacetum coccineum]